MLSNSDTLLLGRKNLKNKVIYSMINYLGEFRVP